jgi:Domain of unknown function (DUF4333)
MKIPTTTGVLAVWAAVQLTGGSGAAWADPTNGSTDTVSPSVAAKAVADSVASQTGFHPYDVSCPTGVEAKVTNEFDCHFTGPEGPYIAHMRITKVDGANVSFFLMSSRRT